MVDEGDVSLGGYSGAYGGGGGSVAASYHSAPTMPSQYPQMHIPNYNNFGGGQGQQQNGGRRMTALQGPMGTRGADSRLMNDDHVTELYQQGFSTGLAKALAENATAFDFRFWVVDNSGSMQIGDGHRIVVKNSGSGKKRRSSMPRSLPRRRSQSGNGDLLMTSEVNNYEERSAKLFKAVPSTRWEEIQDAVKYHAQMAGLLDSPTIFKLLNDPGIRTGPQQFSVGERGEACVAQDIDEAIRTMKKAKPGGVTPLTRHIWELQRSVSEMAPQLERRGKKVAIILATDGLPTDEQGYGGGDITDEFVRALRSLEGLPVWLVVRLCTDEEPVTQFYNSLDSQLELSLEVLDDFMGEAREVYQHNPWICYGLPMHRCRELGYHDRIFDIIDERPLTKGEARSFCCLLFGMDDDDDLPDPATYFVGFIKAVQTKLKSEQLQWNPIKKKMTPWILTSVLARSFGEHKCLIM